MKIILIMYLRGLTCDIQDDRGRKCDIFAQVAGEVGTIVRIEDRCNAHAAANLFISFLQTDKSTIPQPDQLLVGLRLTATVTLTNQRHSLLQLCLYNAITVESWDRVDRNTLEKKRGRRSKVYGMASYAPKWWEKNKKEVSQLKRSPYATRAYLRPGLHRTGANRREEVWTSTSFYSSFDKPECRERSLGREQKMK